MPKKYNFPDDIELIKSEITTILKPISQITEKTYAEKNFLFSAQRTDAGRKLPAYYLCYFLFVDLLGYKNLGQFEKVSWSVPIDYNGIAFLIEHRKFGLGLFARDKTTQEKDAKAIVKLINNAIRVARPISNGEQKKALKNQNLMF